MPARLPGGCRDWVERGELTVVEGERLVAGIKASASQWRQQSIPIGKDDSSDNLRYGDNDCEDD